MNLPENRVYNPTIQNFARENNETVSALILEKLSQLSIKNQKKVFVENPETTVETYHYGNESAKIVKRLHDACVGEDGGKIRYYAEWFDYKQFNWWKTALENLPIYFLETPVDKVAIDAQISSPELIFSPEKVTEYYNLNPKANADRKIACIQWVQDQVVKILNPQLQPDYKVIFLENYFRLIPLTQVAIESRLVQNAAYDRVKEAVLNSVDPLRDSYEKMSKKQNE